MPVVILSVAKDLNAHFGERFFTTFKMTGAAFDYASSSMNSQAERAVAFQVILFKIKALFNKDVEIYHYGL